MIKYELKKYQVWQEGYCCTGMEGESVKAKLIGEIMAQSFAQACHILKCKEYLNNISKVNDITYKKFEEGYDNPDRWDYDPNNLTDWGCRLFDNEESARESFG